MAGSPDRAQRPAFLDALAVYLKPRVLIVLFLGFSSGLPLALSGTTLLVWMRESGVDLGTIGLFALLGTPYTVKFLWAPITDALDVPLLSRWLGRRRGWLVFTQILLMAAIVFLGSCNPATAPGLVALGALLVAAASATQDIVVDAFRVESLPENEQAAGMAAYVAAYRIGMLVSTAGALFLVSAIQAYGFDKQAAWHWGYVAMGALVLIGTATALIATEPERSRQAEAAHAQQKRFARVADAAVGAFKDFLGYEMAFAMLAFVVMFDAYLSALCQNPLHTATQYALLTALAAVGRTYLSSGAGFIAESTGWVWFFVICALAGLPSLILLAWLQRKGHFKRLEPKKA